MAAPNVTVTVEPSEAGSILILPLAPVSTTHPDAAQLSLRFDLTNHETTSVHLTGISLDYDAGSGLPPSTIAADLLLQPGGWGEWHFEWSDNIILPWPAPSGLTAHLAFDGYTTPVSLSAPLAAHASPVAGGAYVFPFSRGSLSSGEYFVGRSASHGAAGGGVQLFAYDLGVVAFDQTSGSWSDRHPGTTGSKNEDYRIWGKPVYAMAGGTVVAFADQYPANPSPPADLSPPNPVEGNHFYLQHGDELVLYAHLQLGTIPSELKQVGASVVLGDYLGLAGNSGNSSAPHTHVHAIKGTQPWQGPLRPLPFRGAGEIGMTQGAGSPMTPPWVDLAGRGLPAEAALIWPGTLPINFRDKLRQFFDIDPLALILRDDVYVKLTLPDPPPIPVLIPQIREALRDMTPAQRHEALARIEAWSKWTGALGKQVAAEARAVQKGEGASEST